MWEVVPPCAVMEDEDVEHWAHKEENEDDREDLWSLFFDIA